MDEEDDEFYAPDGDVTVKHEATNGHPVVKDEDMDDGAGLDQNEQQQDDDDDDDGDDDDDDSDIDIITERRDGAVPEPPPQARPFRGIKPEHPRTASADNVPTQRNQQQPQQQQSQQQQHQQQQQQPPALKTEPSQTNKVTVSLRDGSNYPEVRSSKIDVNAVPTWDPAGKLITEIDMDVDLAEHTKPWRLPGTDQTDFFNYGFDEFTWTQYCMRQQTMASSINAQKQETKQFEMMLAGNMPPAAAAPGPGAAPGAMPMGMPGMADMPPDMMNAMMSSMQAQGLTDPSQLDFGTFMQQMQSMGMPGMPGMPGQGGPGGQGSFGGQSMQHQASNPGFGGQQHSQPSYQQSQSNQAYGGGTPQPQAQGQQNLAQQNQNQQQPGFEGYSAQQLAMMQGGGPPQGPAAAGRGRGRGRRW
ncbi:hypothetical protein MBLNU459_g6568t1 [Dothideomycetes sp. NU459]